MQYEHKNYWLGFSLILFLVDPGQSETRLSQTTFDSTKGDKSFQDSNQAQADATKNDSSSLKISIVPIVAFGFAGMVAGGVIGNLIDPQGDAPGGDEPVFWSTGTVIGMGAGALTGASIGYLIAKKDLKRHHTEKQR